jgi:hypothetical protein
MELLKFKGKAFKGAYQVKELKLEAVLRIRIRGPVPL